MDWPGADGILPAVSVPPGGGGGGEGGFVTSPGDLRDLGRLFRYEARRSPGLIA